jgi:2-polyprenyl-3-methyl-5-hydroxy-6-metoxy-1,4-benzoquinol methylase
MRNTIQKIRDLLSSNKKQRFADNHTLDSFYKAFEDEFRGTEKAIQKRVEFYAELFKREGIEYSKYPIIDIGCGRGELLGVLKRYSIRALGIDLNKDMVDRANTLGLEAQQVDAIQYFKKSKEGSIGAVIGIHIIEHIPFAELIKMFEEVFTALHDDGLAIFETPNPENISVSSYGFHMDPSHLKPLPAPLVKFALERIGFTDIEVLYLHESKKKRKHYKDPMLEELSNRFYGPRDYAVVARKNPGKSL